MAGFCQGTFNLELENLTNKTKDWTYSPDSQTITDLIISGHFRLTYGQTSDQNFNALKAASWQKSAKKRRNF